MVRKNLRFFKVVQISLDATLLFIAFVGAGFLKLYDGIPDNDSGASPQSCLWMVPLLLLIYSLMEVYSPLRRRSFRHEALTVAKAHLAAVVTSFSILFLAEELRYSREIAVYFATLSGVLILAERFVACRVMRTLRYKGLNQKHILVVGAGPLGVDFARKARMHRHLGYKVVGFLDDALAGQTVAGVRVLGECASLPHLLQSQDVEEVVVALPVSAYGKYAEIVQACETAGVRSRIIPDYHQFLPTGTPDIEEFDGIPILNVRRIPLDDPFLSFVKRTLDVVVSSVAIVLTAPLLLLIAAGIKLTSPGPLLFRQERVGLNNRTFEMLKFRSMRVAADNSASTVWTTANDPRKTKFGAFLRKTSLDELPQFFNVLRGDMSVIGPRPERPFFVEQFREQIPSYMVKHQVKPGITGWAQVNGWRGDTSIKKRIECDIYYIENWKLLLDIKIMLLTLYKGLVNKNAY